MVMNKEAFIEKIKKETFWDFVDYYKEWNGYSAYLVGMDGTQGDLGGEHIILVNENIERYATEDEKNKILEIF